MFRRIRGLVASPFPYYLLSAGVFGYGLQCGYHDWREDRRRRQRANSMTFEPHPGRVVQKSVDQENLAPRISDVHSMEDVEASIEELISGPSHITITGAFDGTGFSDRDYTQHMDERHRYSGQLLYEYNVHGRLWLNRDLWLHIPTVELSNSSLSEMNRLFELRVGDPLVVYVNPRNAAQAVLMRGPHPADAEAGASPWPLASAASFSVSVCFFILAFCLHRRRWKVPNRQVS